MDEELRLALILLGTLAIGSVILHGIWTIRRTVGEERKNVKQEELEAEPVVEPDEEEAKQLKLKQMEMDFATLNESKNSEGGIPVVSVDVDSIYSPEAEDKGQEEQSQSDAYQDDMLSCELSDELSEPAPSMSNTVDIDDEVMPQISTLELEDDEPEINIDTVEEEVEQVATESEPEQKQQVLMLYVDKSEGTPIDGAKLLPTLLTLGFKYGEMDLFHRHQDSSGKGEILFSLANMYNPGTFDIDNMEQLTTRGLTIFMTLPNAMEPLQTFNMMHNAAKKIADEFGATVLDDHRRPLDVAIVRSYVEKIRKF